METKKEEGASLSGELGAQLKEDLQLGKIRRFARTWWDFHAHPAKLSQAIVSNSWANYISPISYYCLTVAVLIFVVSLSDTVDGENIYDKLLEPLKPLLMFAIYVFPGAVMFHFALGKRRRKLRDVIHVSCYAQANVFVLSAFSGLLKDHNGKLAIPEQPAYLHAAAYIALAALVPLFILLVVGGARLQMRVFNISFWRMVGTAVLASLWPVPLLLVALLAKLLFGH